MTRDDAVAILLGIGRLLNVLRPSFVRPVR